MYAGFPGGDSDVWLVVIRFFAASVLQIDFAGINTRYEIDSSTVIFAEAK